MSDIFYLTSFVVLILLFLIPYIITSLSTNEKLNFSDNKYDLICDSCLHKNPDSSSFCELCGSSKLERKFVVQEARMHYLQFYSNLKKYHLLPPLDENRTDGELIEELFRNMEEQGFKGTNLEQGLRDYIDKFALTYFRTFFLEEHN
ncbi:MAG: hypothetical protein D6732_18715 [Methanobacteriota archaeon]|nr:MAG: hypothetical protein D6732_18715 [Euryarchaeota archaeon]